MEKARLKLEGVESQDDANKVLHALNEVWGIREAEVNFSNKEALLNFDEKSASLQDFEQAVIDSGFDVTKP